MYMRGLIGILDANKFHSIADNYAAHQQMFKDEQDVSIHETKTGIVGIFTNSPLWIAVLCFSIAQLLKFILTWVETKQFQYERLVGSGGMPSAHSAFVASLATAIGIRDGTGSSLFALSVVFASITMYDAVGLRLHTGRQALALNAVIADTLPEDHPVAPGAFGRLREQLGHTPVQVAAGGTLGVVVALIIQGALGSAVH